MINYEKFRGIFKETDFREEDLRRFYYSIRKSVILGYVGKRSWPDLIKLEEKSQWPVLQRIADPELSIYDGADEKLLDRFVKTISKEKDLRAHKVSRKIPYWTQLQSIIGERTELFTHIFGFSRADIRRCEAVAKRYSDILEKRTKTRKKLWTIGIGAGAATLAGAAALWYISKKDKK